MHDPCFWCGKDRCRRTHGDEIVQYRQGLRNAAANTLKELGWVPIATEVDPSPLRKFRMTDNYNTPHPGNSQYFSIVADNARKAGKSEDEAMRKIRNHRKTGGW